MPIPSDTDTTTTTTTTADAPEVTDTDLTDWKAEAEKWQALSKKHEARSKANLEEAAKAAKEGMTEAEKAISEAELRGKQTAAKEYGTRLAAAEFKAAVAAKGLDLGDALELIDTSRFADADGNVDADAIKTAVAKVAKVLGPQAGKSGGEFAGGTGAGNPITEDQMRKMSPEERVKALEAGLLKHLM